MKVLQQFLMFWKGLRFRLHYSQAAIQLTQLGIPLGLFAAVLLSGFEFLLSFLVLSLTGILYSLLGYPVLIGFLIGLSSFALLLVGIISHLFKGIFPLSDVLVMLVLIYLLYHLGKKHITMERYEKFTDYFDNKEEAWINAFAFEQAKLETVRKKQIWFAYVNFEERKTGKVNMAFLYITEANSEEAAQADFKENIPEFEGEERTVLLKLRPPSCKTPLTDEERTGLAKHFCHQAFGQKIKKRGEELPEGYKVTPFELNRSNETGVGVLRTLGCTG